MERSSAEVDSVTEQDSQCELMRFSLLSALCQVMHNADELELQFSFMTVVNTKRSYSIDQAWQADLRVYIDYGTRKWEPQVCMILCLSSRVTVEQVVTDHCHKTT